MLHRHTSQISPKSALSGLKRQRVTELRRHDVGWLACSREMLVDDVRRYRRLDTETSNAAMGFDG